MIREYLRKYIGEAMDNWCDDNNITENREERFKKEFLETVDDGEEIWYDYILVAIEKNDPDLYEISLSCYYTFRCICKEIVKGD